MNKELIAIFEYLEREKGIKRETIIKAIEESLTIAAKKSIKGAREISTHIDPKTGNIDVYAKKRIVKDVSDPLEEISLKEAKILAPESQIGQVLEILITPKEFGRIAAQTAKQVISQKLKGAERDVIYEEYRHRMREIVSGKVKRIIGNRTLIIDLGKVEALLPDRLYPKAEKYHIGERVQALLLEVRDTEGGGAEVILSRSHPEFVAELFRLEVPEINEGTVVIEKIVREADYRTKLVVRSKDRKVDPVGTCVGIHGTRIKNIIREIHNEKIDVIPYSEDKIQLLQNALAPIEIKRIKVTEDKVSIVIADEDYPTVIGKKGMNARLLSRLIESEIDVQKMTDHQNLIIVQMKELGDSEDPSLDKPLKIKNLNNLILESLISAGYDTIRKILVANPEDIISQVPGINYLDLADKILEQEGIRNWEKS